MNFVPATIKKQYGNFHERMHDALTKWWGDSAMKASDEDFWPPFQSAFQSGPSVDIEETEEEILVRAETPGLDKDDFSVELNRNSLVIRGEKKNTRESKDGDYHRYECSYGSFSRSIPLPCEVADDKADAEYKNGVLYIRLPKTESGKRKRINVKTK